MPAYCPEFASRDRSGWIGPLKLASMGSRLSTRSSHRVLEGAPEVGSRGDLCLVGALWFGLPVVPHLEETGSQPWGGDGVSVRAVCPRDPRSAPQPTTPLPFAACGWAFRGCQVTSCPCESSSEQSCGLFRSNFL